MSGPMDRGRPEDKMSESKRYNSTSPAPQAGVGRASSTHSHTNSPASYSASNSPRIGTVNTTEQHHHKRHSSSSGLQGGRKGYNDSPSTPDSGLPGTRSPAHLSPVLRDGRTQSRGRSSSEASHRSGSQHSGVTGRKGYNEEVPTRDSRSSSIASGSSPARRATDLGPNFSPRIHAGMSGRKGYNQENPGAAADPQDSAGLGLSRERSPRRHDGPTGRKGYQGTQSPRR